MRKDNQIADTYRTRDLNLAAYLIAQPSIRFDGLYPVDQRIKEFSFTPKSRCEKFASDFVTGRGEMSVRRFCEGLRTAKDILFKMQREELEIR